MYFLDISDMHKLFFIKFDAFYLEKKLYHFEPQILTYNFSYNFI
jgi:hypothetical protein